MTVWEPVPITAPHTQGSVIKHANSLWLLGGYQYDTGPVLFTSPNRTTWTAVSTVFDDLGVEDAAFGHGVWIAVGDLASSGTGWLIRSTDNGVTWNTITMPYSASFGSCIAYSAELGMWVAGARSADNNHHICTSVDDGVTWTIQSSVLDGGGFAAVNRVDYGGGKFVIVGEASGEIYMETSTNGTAWTSRHSAFVTPGGAFATPPATSYRLLGVRYGGGQWIACGHGGNNTQVVFTSSDAVTWTVRTTPVDSTGSDGWAVEYGGGRWVVVVQGVAGDLAITSTNGGLTWRQITSPFGGTGDIDTVRFDSTFIATGGTVGGGSSGGGGGTGGGSGGGGTGGGGGGGGGGTAHRYRFAFRFGASVANVATVEGPPGNFGTSGGVLVHGIRGTLSDLKSDQLVLNPWGGSGRRISFTACAMPQTGNNAANYAAAIAGDYDDAWHDMNSKLALPLGSGGYGFPGCIQRPLHEFNLSYGGEWNVTGVSAADYITAFRRYVSIAREHSTSFVFDWCWLIGGDVNVFDFYPGDAYVDIIGIDVYDRRSWGDDFNTRWNTMVALSFGLQEHLNFGNAHNKLLSFPEWGVANYGSPNESVSGGDNYVFVANMIDWINTYNFEYHTPYFDDNSAVISDMLDGNFPLALAQLHSSLGS